MDIKPKIPPQAQELEEAVLGAALVDDTAPRMLLSLVKQAEVFYVEKHRVIFRAVQSLFQEGQPIDLLTVTNELRKSGDIEAAGGAYALMALSNKVTSGANLPKHCSILLETFTRRELIIAANDVANKAYESTNDVFDLLTQNQHNLNRLTDALSIKDPQTLDRLYYQAMEEISKATQAKGLTGVPSGLASLDEITGGWQPSDLIILAARPAMGKTSLAVQFGRNAAIDFGKPGVIFSLEMSSVQLTKKLIATESNLTTNQLSKGNLPGGDLGVSNIHRQTQKLINRHIIIDDEPGLNIQLLRAKSARLKADRHIQWIIIDYLQLMAGDGKNKGSREQEISSISRGLKILAKELQVPVIALSQLSRAVESRQDKRPMLSDLRESGAIEQDADQVIFLYRPEYYGVTEDEMGNPTAGTAEIIFSKNRNGPVGTVIAGCNIQFGKFYDLRDTPPAPAEFNPNKLPESQFEPAPF